MTDTPIPEGDLTAAESEELLLMCGHAPGPEPLSPAAQAVLDAVCDNTEPDCDTQHLIAAALRAAADQVVPPEQETPWGSVVQAHAAELRIRNQLLSIATELEAQ